MSYRNDEHVASASKVDEDGPVMRSVAIMSPQAMAPLDSFQRLSLQSDKPLLHKQNAFGKLSIVPPSNNVLNEKEQPSPWCVVKALPLPSHYQLDRSHVKISDVSTVEISKRIADYLFKESTSATFDNDQSLATASTSSCLKFHVRIWESLDVNIVEVQRYAGCGIEFQGTVKELLSVAKTGKVAPNRCWSLPMPRCLPKLPDNIWRESTSEALEIARDGLKSSNRIDSHSLALESLEQLSCSQHCRTFCADAILSSNSELLSIIVALIHRTDLTSRQISEDNEVGLDDCYRLMRRGAVNILSNCLESVMDSSQSIERVIDGLLSVSDHKTLSALVLDIAKADSNTHDAAASCRCVNLLCKSSDKIKQRVLALGVAEHIAAAATCRHLMLQQESKQLLELL